MLRLWVGKIAVVHLAEQSTKETREILFEVVGQCAHVLRLLFLSVGNLSRKQAKENVFQKLGTFFTRFRYRSPPFHSA